MTELRARTDAAPCLACIAGERLPENATPGELLAAGMAFGLSSPFLVLCPKHRERFDDVARGWKDSGSSWALLHNAGDRMLAAFLHAHPAKLPSMVGLLEVLEWLDGKLTDDQRALFALWKDAAGTASTPAAKSCGLCGASIHGRGLRCSESCPADERYRPRRAT
jgi:hypothetical protein